jgi:hypothetical protein
VVLALVTALSASAAAEAAPSCPTIGDESAKPGTREGSLRSLFKSVFYPPKCGNMVKMLDARSFFLFFFWSGASGGSIVVSSIPRPQLLTELRAPTGR